MLSLSSSLAVEYECFVEMLSKEEGRRTTPSLQQPFTANNKQLHKPTITTILSAAPSAAVCVTQTLLNGLARYAGRYLQKMHLLPSTAAEVNALSIHHPFPLHISSHLFTTPSHANTPFHHPLNLSTTTHPLIEPINRLRCSPRCASSSTTTSALFSAASWATRSGSGWPTGRQTTRAS